MPPAAKEGGPIFGRLRTVEGEYKGTQESASHTVVRYTLRVLDHEFGEELRRAITEELTRKVRGALPHSAPGRNRNSVLQGRSVLYMPQSGIISFDGSTLLVSLYQTGNNGGTARDIVVDFSHRRQEGQDSAIPGKD